MEAFLWKVRHYVVVTMKKQIGPLVLAGLLTVGLAHPIAAERKSLLDSEPDVVYTDEFTEKDIELLAVKPGAVYASKKGGRKLGVLKLNSKAKLVGFTERAYKIEGQATHAGISGWVAPSALASKDKNFIQNLKKVYERQLEVRELIANHEVAIGMSMDEVAAAMGKPTKTKIRRTAKGQSGKWEFIVFEEVGHYQMVRNPETGIVFRQLTHTTKEEISKLVVEFENDVVTALEESENNDGGSVKIVVPPVVLGW